MPRYTQQSEKVFQLAKDFAREMKSPRVNSGHLLFALLKEGSGLAYNVLKNHRLSVDATRRAVWMMMPVVDESLTLPDDLPWSTTAQLISKSAAEEAIDLGHNYVGTEHILLAFTQFAPEWSPGRGIFFQSLGVNENTFAALRQEVLSCLGHAQEKSLASRSYSALKFRKGDLCVFKCAGGVEPVLITRDVEEASVMAPASDWHGCVFSTSVDNLFHLCQTDGQFSDPREAMKNYSSEIILNLAGILMSQRDAVNYPHLTVFRHS